MVQQIAEGSQFRVLLADDHELVRSGLIGLLGGEPDIDIVGEAATGLEAIELCERLRPNLVLMDVRLPELDGIAATAAIKERWPGVNVLILTLYLDQEYLYRAIKAGAAGYVLKDASRSELIHAVRRVCQGQAMLDPALAMQLFRRLSREGAASPAAPAERLTPRELEILRQIVEGKTNPEIAYDLEIGVGTVKSHVEHIIAKLGVTDRTQAAVRAVQQGLFATGPVDEPGDPSPSRQQRGV